MQKIDAAKDFNEKLEKLDIGYRLKSKTDHTPSYKAKLDRLNAEHSVNPNSYLSAEIVRWHSYWKGNTSSETESYYPKSKGLPDFAKLFLTAIVVIIVLAFLGSLLM